MSLTINPSSIPVALRERPQWVLWRIENRGGAPTKIPYSTDGPPARSNDPSTWAPFDVVLDVFERGGTAYSGIGYVFSESDEFCGIDLDGCHDPETNEWSDWARTIIADLDSYTELSPSGSGAKIFIRGKCPLASGKNTRLPGVASRGGKQAGIEVYDKLRYFAVTGRRLKGTQPEPMERQDVLERLCTRWFVAGDGRGGDGGRGAGGGGRELLGATVGFEPPVLGRQEVTGGPAVVSDAAASGLSPPSAPAPHPPAPAPHRDAVARASRYVARMPVSISGNGGHNAAFHVACTLVLGFGLSQEEAFRVMADWNQACQPPWSEKELRHKLADAEKQPGERNYLRDAPRDGDVTRLDATNADAAAASGFTSGATGGDRIKQLGGPPVSSNANAVREGSTRLVSVSLVGEEHWTSTSSVESRPKAAASGTPQTPSVTVASTPQVPFAAAGVTPQVPSAAAIVPPRPKAAVPVAPLWRPSRTLEQSARDYLAATNAGNTNLMSLGLPAVDCAIGGGVERSEVIIIGARPSHGKTCVGLQAAYTAAAAGRPVLIISEEMSPLALGKRAIQFASDVPEEHWRRRESDVLAQLETHFAPQAPIHIVESCGTVERAADAIRRHVEAVGVQCVVVDYGQLLGSRGGNRYEQMSRTSITLRQLANELKLTMIVLAQLNRAIETREKFIPRLSDLRDAGQWEQDADVILFLLWPNRVDAKHNRHEYFIFIAKNRNRPTHATSVKCQFEPARQRLLLDATTPSETELDEWSERYREF